MKTTKKKTREQLALLSAASFLALVLPMQTVAAAETRNSSEPPAGTEYRVFWGDTHLHSATSLDANLYGLTNIGPETAYQYARGEAITAANGVVTRIQQPLDFLVVTDHAEYLGLMPLIREQNPLILQNPVAQSWSKTLRAGSAEEFSQMMIAIGNSYEKGEPLVTLPKGLPSPWEANNLAADNANLPGTFTTFIGYEWSAMPKGNNLHRVVILADDAAHANQVSPFSAFDSDEPEQLWSWLEHYEKLTGGRALAIPHNSNLSGGMMFAETKSDGKAIDLQYAEMRARWEPLLEVTQIKGDSEAHPQLSPDDAFADYATWDQYNIAMSEPQRAGMQQYQYARPALQLGLKLEQQVGVNPFRFGLIGSSDSHTGMPAVEENNFWGKKVGDEPGPQRSQGIWGIPEAGMPNTLQEASGYMAVWARENTRAALFDAMRRREVYATTGPRMVVSFFAGWGLQEADVGRDVTSLMQQQAAVAMGAILPRQTTPDTSPAFVLRALKAPNGANLDRIQLIKGWLDKSGKTRERIYNVSWSGERQPDQRGILPGVGNTVDLKKASYTNTIGASELSAYWQDPEFDPLQPAVYYMRVLEIPTPRWPLYDQVQFDMALPQNTKVVHQERAYTSPIWYRPPAPEVTAIEAAQ